MLVSRPSAAAFQSTLPRRERPTRTTLRCSSVYFNPRSREGSDLEQLLSGHYAVDFNPRSREGSDLSVSVIHGNHTNFNPRSREGSDVKFDTVVPRVDSISIHAPAKGATGCTIICNDWWRHFNPRSREGSDDGTHAGLLCFYAFQSTLPRRERHAELFERFGFTHFNPRSREGSDVITAILPDVIPISIHALAKGATTALPIHQEQCSHFNPRSREGSDVGFFSKMM